MRYFIYAIFLLPSVVYGIYFFVMSLGAFKRKRRTVRAYAPEKRFAVLIAARNEERVIADLIHSVKAQAYPSRLYDVFVIPNNCTDGTEQAALAAGARILHVRPPIKTKGDVLKQAFDILQPLGYDGYVILDADNLVSPNFLQRMNDALCAGYPAAQGKRESKNPDDNWITGSYTIYFGVINFLINRARMNMDCNAIFYGTGMMISATLLSQTGYPIRTVTEDMEYAMLCSLAGKQIAFVEDAVFYDEQPIRFIESMKQRRRWTAGSYSCFRLYKKRLALEALGNNNKNAFDILLFAFAPMFQVILTFICFIISIVEFCRSGYYFPSMIVGLLSGAAGYLAQMFFAWFIVKLQGRNYKKNIMGILLFPLFLMSWFPLSCYCFFKNNEITWEPIAHTRSCDIRQV